MIKWPYFIMIREERAKHLMIRELEGLKIKNNSIYNE